MKHPFNSFNPFNLFNRPGYRCAALCLLLAVPQAISKAATCDDWVSQGRAALAARNLVTANACFSNAVTQCPNDSTGNVFYAITRLLVLPSQPAGSNFLSRLEVPTPGRNLYDWTAIPPSDGNHVPFAPCGVNADELPAFARTNILPQLIGAEANLTNVGKDFTLDLTADEALGTAVTVDYGDIRMLRAMLEAAQYACYAADSYNSDAMLTPIRWLYDDGELTAERLLTEYPRLLTFTTTNYLEAAKAALLEGAACYFEASEFIRNRPANVGRLFNYAPEKAEDEEKFRWTLADLTNSLDRVVSLRAYPNYSAYAGTIVNGSYEPRSFLPVIRGNGFGLGSLPDLTFGGLVYEAVPGVIEESVEESLARGLFPIPTIAPGFARTGSQFQLAINTLKGRGYAVEVSSDLRRWTNCTAFFSFANGYAIVDPEAHGFNQRYYRVVDRTTNMPPPPNDDFANRIQLTGLGITAVGYDSSASLERNEPWIEALPHGFPSPATVWWSWTAPVSGLVEVATTGSTADMYAAVYTGNVLSSLRPVAYSGQPFYAVAGTTYQIQVVTVAQHGGGVNLVISAPPVLSVQSPADGTVSLVVTNFRISASATDPDGSISRLGVHVDGSLLTNTTGSSLSMIWSNVSAGNHNVLIEATDNLGLTTYSNLTVTVRPPNDNFTNRIPITGASAVVMGTNDGATTETNEPPFGGNSVWWSWTAPSNGYVTISADLVVPFFGHVTPPLAVYRGASLLNLTTVARDDGASDFYGAPAQVSFMAAKGVEYSIAVYGLDWWYSSVGGQITLSLVPTEPPQISITSPANGAILSGPTNVLVSADAIDNDGSISRVDFFDNIMKVGSVTHPPYTLILSNLQSGTVHMLVAKATDNMGVSTYSDPVEVTIETVLSLNVPATNLSGAKDSTAYYVISVSTNVTRLEISTYGGTGDCDLYVAFGYLPSLYWWDYRPYLDGNNETVTINSPWSGDWHIMLHGWEAYSGVSLEADAFGAPSRPPNDTFANRIVITGMTNTLTGSNTGASKEPGEPNHAGNAGGRSVWWTWTAPMDGMVTVDTIGSTFDTLLAVYTGDEVWDLTLVASDDQSGGGNTSALTFYAASGTTYQIAVDGFQGDSGSIVLHLWETSGTPPGPPNDAFANRIVITGTSDTVTGSNVWATKEPGEPDHAGDAGGKSVWWRWTAPLDGTVTVDTIGSSFDTLLAVYTGDEIWDLTLVASDDESGGNSTSALTFSATAGTVYQIAVDGYQGDSGSIVLHVMEEPSLLQEIYSFPELPTPNSLVNGSDRALYGTISGGGSGGFGSVFRLATNGTLTTLASFARTNGAHPNGPLVQGADGSFYGTTYDGGDWDAGTVFRVTTNGLLVTLASFSWGEEGGNPQGALLQVSDGAFYGTAQYGGSAYEGTVFRVTADGVLTSLASFAYTNGAYPSAALVQGNDGALYGTTPSGGLAGNGTVFRVTTNGVLTRLASFTDASPTAGALAWGADGALYGTTEYGGDSDAGTVFRVTTNGVLTPLISFEYDNGAYPLAGLMSGSDGLFYGTTEYGGSDYAGTVFSVTTSGNLTPLASFTYDNGSGPNSCLAQGPDGAFYGVAPSGGDNNYGTVFRTTGDGMLTALMSFANDEGSAPATGVVQGGDGALYGTTYSGGDTGYGTVFRVMTDGALTTLASFEDYNGAYPAASLTPCGDGTFYGTTYDGGDYGAGSVFQVTTNGDLTTLVSFDYDNGRYPQAGLVLGSDGAFYGTTAYGGTNDSGTVFQVTTNGDLSWIASFAGTNGVYPRAPLLLGSDGAYYGTTESGGARNYGTVFRVTTNGTLTTLVSFASTNGAYPAAALVWGNDRALYGTTQAGGVDDCGTVFKVTTNGALTTLWSFEYYDSGDRPAAALVLGSDGAFYGTTQQGGISDYGTVFRLKTNGVLTTLGSFNFANGSQPWGLVQAADGNLYGTCAEGGSRGGGNIFRVAINSSSVPLVSLGTRRLGNSAAPGRADSASSLRSAPSGTFPKVSAATSPYRNPITGLRQPFRLKAN